MRWNQWMNRMTNDWWWLVLTWPQQPNSPPHKALRVCQPWSTPTVQNSCTICGDWVGSGPSGLLSHSTRPWLFDHGLLCLSASHILNTVANFIFLFSLGFAANCGDVIIMSSFVAETLASAGLFQLSWRCSNLWDTSKHSLYYIRLTHMQGWLWCSGLDHHFVERVGRRVLYGPLGVTSMSTVEAVAVAYSCL